MSHQIMIRPLEWSIRPAAARIWVEYVDLDRGARVWGAIRSAARAEGTSPTLSHAVRACAVAMSAVGAGFAMTRDGGTWEPLISSGPEATELDEVQFTLGEGPSCDALRRGTPVLESDLAGLGAGRRWPAFTAAATERGIAAAFAFPIGVGAARVGVLTVYRTERGPLPGELLHDALVYADAVLVLALDDRVGAGTDPEQVVSAAFSTRRAEVHQATGAVAAQLGVSVTDALARIRAYAYSSGQTLQEVAAAVMAGELRFEIDHTAPRTKETDSQHGEQQEDS
ncbi:GAF and ANTAR domain-containing protein [Kribbella sp. NPDC051936]|uniref:GAF and ANTAR domain-containing protein n=1 Tax=Kribbella sp. NPDC051936 TaxID=3154946 RepID=UPI0034221BED